VCCRDSFHEKDHDHSLIHLLIEIISVESFQMTMTIGQTNILWSHYCCWTTENYFSLQQELQHSKAHCHVLSLNSDSDGVLLLL